MKIKIKILEYIYHKNTKFFQDKTPKINLEKIYEDNKDFFEAQLVKDFTGFIPKEVSEPTLRAFKDYGQDFERWTLWQSWYVNRRAINDPLKITYYAGMMLYLKVLNTMARTNQKNYQPNLSVQNEGNKKVEVPFIEKALEGLDEFNKGINKKNDVQNN